MLNSLRLFFKYPEIYKLNNHKGESYTKAFNNEIDKFADRKINKKIMVFGAIVAFATCIQAVTSIISCYQNRNTHKIETTK